MALYSRLERRCFQGSCMYIGPEFSKMFSNRNFFEYLYPYNVLKKQCRLCCVLKCHWVISLYLVFNQIWFTKFNWRHTYEVLERVYARAYVTSKHKFNGAECRWVINGAENLKVLHRRYVYHVNEELHGFISCKAPDMIGIENSMMNPGVMDLITYAHVIWVELHEDMIGMEKKK